MADTQTNFENLRIYQLASELADDIWQVVGTWDRFARDTVGKQLVRAADSVGANIAEGCGHHSLREKRRFVRIACASLYETKHWLRTAYRRQLLPADAIPRLRDRLATLLPQMNAYQA